MDCVIETNDLTKTYGTFAAVNNVSIHVPRGKIYGLLGRNGAGKTTLLSMLLKLTHPTCGAIKLFGEDYNGNPKTVYSKIGSIIENPGFYENLTGEENLLIQARLRGLRGKDPVRKALEAVGLEHESGKTFGKYSLGMKQRLGIAAAIMHEPELLILDEPINGLDPVGITVIRNYLKKLSAERNVTILISSHILGEIEHIADMMGVMSNGSLIEEVTAEQLHDRCRKYTEFEVSDLITAKDILEKCFGIFDYSSEYNTVKIYDMSEDVAEINKAFVYNGISVMGISVAEDSLEEYFSKLIGGVGIA